MHDTAKLLDRGIPAVCICTEPFSSAARVHGQMLGWAGYEAVAIPHPLQTLAADAVGARAASIVETVVERLCGGRREEGA
jgi:hypothetical protein